MSRAPHKSLKILSEYSAIKFKQSLSVAYLSGVVNGQRNITKARAEFLEDLTAQALGLDIPAQVWMFGPPNAIKKALRGVGNPRHYKKIV